MEQPNKPVTQYNKIVRWICWVMTAISAVVLAIMMLQDLVARKRVLGGRKWPWAVAIIFVIFFGSLVYLLCHPKIFYDGNDK